MKDEKKLPELTKEEERQIEIHWIKEQLGCQNETDNYYNEDREEN